MKKICNTFLLLFLFCYAQAQTSISGTININAKVDSINFCANTIYLPNTAGFSVGDRILLIQMKGADVNLTNTASFGNISSYNSAGNYEFATIASLTAISVTPTNTLSRTYQTSGLVQLVRVPVYASASVDGPLTCQPWNGTTGGVLAFEATNLVLNANIDVSEMGFKGGDAGNFPTSCPTGLGTSLYYSDTLSGKGGEKGEGIAILTNAYLASRGKAANGGGGGNDHNGGAGGGANGAAAGIGGENDEAVFSCPGSPGIAGIALDQTMASDKIFLGGGGGAGHGNNNNGSDGGNGGGIVIIVSDAIDGNGFSIISNGETVADLAWGDGAGGGGAGGSILIKASTVIETSLIAKGGKGGDSGAPQCTGPGGGGSGGVIKHSGATLWPGITSNLSGGIYGTNITVGSPCLGLNNGAATGGTGIIVPSLLYAESTTPYNPDFANAGPDVNMCSGTSVNFSASGGVSYQWSPATFLDNAFISNPICTPLTNINYILTVTNANGCIDKDTLQVHLFPAAIADAGTDINVCAGSSAMLNAVGGVAYAWSPALFLDNAFISNPTTTPAYPIVYTVTVTDANGCMASDAVSVGIFDSDFLTVGDAVSVCAGGSVALFASGGTSYTWSPDTYLDDATSATPICTPLTDIIYTVTAISTDGCSATAEVVVTANSTDFLVLPGDLALCLGESTTLTATGGISYNWTPALYLDDATSATPTCTPLADITYVVYAYNADGCADIDTISIIVSAGDFASASPPATICGGMEIPLFASGGTSYVWSPSLYLDDPFSATPICTPYADITYYVSVTNVSGCVDVDTVVLTVYPEFTVVAGPDSTICIGGQIKLFVTEGVSYNWTPSTFLDFTNVASPTSIPSSSIDYIVYVTDANGCIASDTVSIIVNPSPTIYGGEDVIICRGDTISLSATGGINYIWTPAPLFACGTCETVEVSPTSTTNYLVKGFAANGCFGFDNVLVTVDICSAIENILAQQIFIYPNPAKTFISIQVPPTLQNATIKIYTILGAEIPVEIKRNNGIIEVFFNDVAPGEIIVKIIGDGVVVGKRVLKVD